MKPAWQSQMGVLPGFFTSALTASKYPLAELYDFVHGCSVQDHLLLAFFKMVWVHVQPLKLNFLVLSC